MSLLATTQGLLERTYATVSGVGDLGRFVIGDMGYRRLLRDHDPIQVVNTGVQAHVSHAGTGDTPRVLVRQWHQGAALSIYFPDALIARLESRPPTAVLDDGNVDDFADFVEEIDHFLVLYDGICRGREMHLLALETRANISKALVVSHFLGRLSGRRRLGPDQRQWVRYHLFSKKRFNDPDPVVRRRYRDARRFALRLLERLEGLSARQRIRELRRWNSLPAQEKMRELAAN
ncbi:MAG: hypothetical protein E2P03_00480 [Acidobacteria bacterium]|nr:MAG: hypothetical protein E2P03_00480 [Acidobacteriota bacterium]